MDFCVIRQGREHTAYRMRGDHASYLAIPTRDKNTKYRFLLLLRSLI